MQSGNVLSNFLDLPDEAIFAILANSLPEDIIAIRRVNRRLRDIATDNRLWKAKFQIHFPHLFEELNKIKPRPDSTKGLYPERYQEIKAKLQ